MVNVEKNLLLEQELFLLWDGKQREWRRVLYFDERGQGVEVVLTPANPKSRDSWVDVGRMIVRMHRTFSLYGNGVDRQGDRLWRYVVRNRHSIVFSEVQKAMLKNLKFECVNRLLHWEFLSQIDWDKYIANKQAGGGCAFALCKRLPKR